MNIELLMQYIRPELIVVSIALYFVGATLKNTKYIKDELIPWILGFISLVICSLYILAVSETPTNYHEILALVFDIIIQAIFCAAASVYVNQLYKQTVKLSLITKEEETEEDESNNPKVN